MGAVRLTFEKICETVAPIAERHGMIQVYLFGSRACGDDHEGSDIDLFVVPPEGCGAMCMVRFYTISRMRSVRT